MHGIDRYFAKNPAVRHAWQLEPWSGPQSASDRRVDARYSYLGTPKRFMWFSNIIFRQELAALAPGGHLLSVNESVFMEALARTTARAANHSVVRNYLTPFSGPQCFCQRHDAALFHLEPAVHRQRVLCK